MRKKKDTRPYWNNGPRTCDWPPRLLALFLWSECRFKVYDWQCMYIDIRREPISLPPKIIRRWFSELCPELTSLSLPSESEKISTSPADISMRLGQQRNRVSLYSLFKIVFYSLWLFSYCSKLSVRQVNSEMMMIFYFQCKQCQLYIYSSNFSFSRVSKGEVGEKEKLE